MKKYLIGLSLVGSLLLVGCSDSTDVQEKDVVDNSNGTVSEDVNKGDSGKVTEEPNTESPVSENDIIIEGFGSVKEAIQKEYNYNDSEYEQVVQLYSKDSYDYESFIPGESEKIKFYKENSIIHDDIKNQKEDVYLVYFFSPTCIYCNEFYPTVSEYVEKENAYPFYKLNVDILENYFAWNEYNISGTPTLILYDKVNDKVLDTITGATSLESIPVIK